MNYFLNGSAFLFLFDNRAVHGLVNQSSNINIGPFFLTTHHSMDQLLIAPLFLSGHLETQPLANRVPKYRSELDGISTEGPMKQ